MTSRQAGPLQSGAPKRDSGRITGVSQVKAMGGRTVMRDGQEVTIYHPRSGSAKESGEAVRLIEETGVRCKGRSSNERFELGTRERGHGHPVRRRLCPARVLSGNSPDYKSSDSKILDWYSSHSHRVSDIAGIFVLAISAAFFLWFLGHLRVTLMSAEGAGGRAASIAMASGTAFIALLAVAGSSFTAIAFVVSEAGSEFTLEPNTFRLLSGFGFLTYVVAFMLGAPLALGIGVVAWRTRLLPRWLAAASLVAGIGALASFTFITTLIYVAWILILSCYLAFRPSTTSEPAGQ